MTIAKTYVEWRRIGYHVIRGRKSCGRNEAGECVFLKSDVESSEDNVGDYDYDHPMESVLQLEF